MLHHAIQQAFPGEGFCQHFVQRQRCLVGIVKEFVQEELKNGTLIEIPLEIPIPTRVIGFGYHAADESDTLREFLDFCRKFHRL